MVILTWAISDVLTPPVRLLRPSSLRAPICLPPWVVCTCMATYDIDPFGLLRHPALRLLLLRHRAARELTRPQAGVPCRFGPSQLSILGKCARMFYRRHDPTMCHQIIRRYIRLSCCLCTATHVLYSPSVLPITCVRDHTQLLVSPRPSKPCQRTRHRSERRWACRSTRVAP